MSGHAIDVLSACHHLMDFARACINNIVFLEGSPGKEIVDANLTEAQMRLQYREQYRNMGV